MDERVDLEALLRSGHLAEYEARQHRPCFRGADMMLGFLGERGRRCRFVSAYRVAGVVEGEVPLPADFPTQAFGCGRFRYDLVPDSTFSDLFQRLVIDWGASTRSWVQWLKPKDVIEILPVGYVRDFPGYEDIVLDFDALQRVVRPGRRTHVLVTVDRPGCSSSM